jgi:hypothetical protein
MSCNKQARARLVEIAIDVAARPKCRDCDGTGNYMLGTAPNACGACDGSAWRPMADAFKVRHRAGMNPCKGPWAAAGITAAMEDAGLLVPSPGTPARRGAIALLDWIAERGNGFLVAGGRPPDSLSHEFGIEEWRPLLPGDIIAWLQHPPPNPAGWRSGHVAVIVAVDDESITTVGWSEGPKPGSVMMRRLWRDANATQRCRTCHGAGCYQTQKGTRKPYVRDGGVHNPPGRVIDCGKCRKTGQVAVPRSSTVLWRRPGGLYGIARPVARS